MAIPALHDAPHEATHATRRWTCTCGSVYVGRTPDPAIFGTWADAHETRCGTRPEESK